MDPSDPILAELDPRERQMAVLTNLRMQRCLEVREYLEKEIEARQNNAQASCREIVDYTINHPDPLLSQVDNFMDLDSATQFKNRSSYRADQYERKRCIVS